MVTTRWMNFSLVTFVYIVLLDQTYIMNFLHFGQFYIGNDKMD